MTPGCARTAFRALCVALLLGAPPGHAAVPTLFAMLGDSPSVAWSEAPLGAGDVIEVHAFKAEPGTTVVLALCNDRCDDAHVVKSIAVKAMSTASFTERYTLPQGGHLAFWAIQPPRPELNAGASRAISNDSRNPVAGALHSGFSGLDAAAEAMPVRKSEIDTDRIKLRFDGGRYVTVSRISAALPANP